MEEEGALASTVPRLFNDAGLLKLLLLGETVGNTHAPVSFLRAE